MRVRKIKFDLEKKLVRHYFKGNMFSTHPVKSLHIIFPKGEKFFIRSCRKYSDRIEDKQLKKDSPYFIGQKSKHSSAYRYFWQFIEKQGFAVKPLVNFFNRTMFFLRLKVLEQYNVSL
ncbi:MAG: metal-dependent hydrolase [Bacteroidetes bacterium]|nr:metal-dependent hydrolase [Bacteroidota bacterium]